MPKRSAESTLPTDDQGIESFRADLERRWYQEKAALLSELEALHPHSHFTSGIALKTCVSVLKLAAVGIPFDELNDYMPIRHTGLAHRAFEIADELIHLAVDAVYGTIERRELELLRDATSRRLNGATFLHSERVTLVLSVVGAAYLRRRGPLPRRAEAAVRGADTTASLTASFIELSVVCCFPEVHSQPVETWPWAEILRGEVGRHFPDVAARMRDADIDWALRNLSRRARSSSDGKWATLAELIHRVGLGRISPEALRAEMHPKVTPEQQAIFDRIGARPPSKAKLRTTRGAGNRR